jgi:hypothetical protein
VHLLWFVSTKNVMTHAPTLVELKLYAKLQTMSYTALVQKVTLEIPSQDVIELFNVRICIDPTFEAISVIYDQNI